MTINSRPQSNYRKLTLNGEAAFCALLAVIWAYYTVGSYAVQLLRRLPIIGSAYQSFLPLCVILLTACSLQYILTKLRPVDLLFYLVMAFIVLVTMLLPENSTHIEPYVGQILFFTVPLYFVGVALPFEESKKVLYWASLAGVLTIFGYQMYMLSQGMVLLSDSMSTAYKVLPSVMYLIYWTLVHKRVRDWLFSMVGIVLVLLCGTRGPIVVILCFVLVETVIRLFAGTFSWKRLPGLCLLLLAVVWLLNDNIFQSLMEFLLIKFREMGFSTRIFEYVLRGDFSVSNSRDAMATEILGAIGNNPVFGYGFMGDRIVLNGNYAHNLALELWCQFGIFVGSFILIGVVAVPIAAMWKNRKSQRLHLLLMLSCVVFVKLMLSGSYVNEKYFFLLLGLAMGQLRSARAGEGE